MDKQLARTVYVLKNALAIYNQGNFIQWIGSNTKHLSVNTWSYRNQKSLLASLVHVSLPEDLQAQMLS
jgi:hypothetical protein